jgi:hypothetical protein
VTLGAGKAEAFSENDGHQAFSLTDDGSSISPTHSAHRLGCLQHSSDLDPTPV